VVRRAPEHVLPGRRGLRGFVRREETSMFVFFSNRVGCAGSLVVSALLTLAIIVLMRACNHA
jgi:hypothetical protein